MKNEITYTQQGDYLLPDLIVPKQPTVEIGIWGRRHERYLKQHHNELNIRTELDDMLDELYDKLDKMTPEERMAWYSRGMYVKPLKYTQDIDNTIYIVRTNFNENTDSTVYDAVERITSKDI